MNENCENCIVGRPHIGRLAGVTRTMRLALYEGEGVPEGTPQDLTGLTTVVRVLRDGTNDIYTPDFVIEGTDNNVVKFVWPAARQAVGNYTFEVTMTDGSGNVSRVNWHGPTGMRLVEYSYQEYGEDATGVESSEDVNLVGYFTTNGVGMSAYEEWLASDYSEGYDQSVDGFMAWLRRPATDAASAAETQMGQIQERADEDHRVAGADHTLADSDHTRAGNDHTRAEGDHTTAADDHRIAAADHETAGDDHTLAAADHVTAVADHETAGDDHTLAASDHGTATDDHRTAGADHETATADHGTAGDDHTQAGLDHTQAVSDHGVAAGDHTRAAEDHTQAGNDHTRAEADHGIAADDHTRATADHAVMAGYDTRLGNVESEVNQLGQVLSGLTDFSIVNGSQGNQGNTWVVTLRGVDTVAIPVTPGKKYKLKINKIPESGFNFYWRICTYSTNNPSNLNTSFKRNEVNNWNTYYTDGQAVDILEEEYGLSIQLTELTSAGAAQSDSTCIALRTTSFTDGDLELLDVTGGVFPNIEDIHNELNTRAQEIEGGLEDLKIVDNDGNVLAVFSNGHFQTLRFDSSSLLRQLSEMNADIQGRANVENADETTDLNIIDGNGNCLAIFKGGHLKIANFDSSDASAKIQYLLEVAEKLAPRAYTAQYIGEKIHLEDNKLVDKTWGVFTGLPMAQSFATYGDYIVFTYGSPNYGAGSLWRISTKEKITDLTFPHTGYEAPHGNVSGFSNEFAQNNTDLPLFYLSQWDNEGGCFVYDIHLDGTVNLVQTIMTDGNMGESFGLPLGDWVLDVRGGFLWSAKYKVSAYHASGNGMMFCKFNIPSTSEPSVILSASDILDSFEIDSNAADLTVTQDKVINNGRMFITCGFGNAEYPATLYVIDLLGHRVASFIDIASLHSGEPEGLDVYNAELLYAFGTTTVYSLTF